MSGVEHPCQADLQGFPHFRSSRSFTVTFSRRHVLAERLLLSMVPSQAASPTASPGEATYRLTFPISVYERVLAACHTRPVSWGMHIEQV